MISKERTEMWLSLNPWLIVSWAGTGAFISYLSMYMYRKPFTAAVFEGMMVWGMDYKIVLVISQVIGYAISKFIGIRFISSLEKKRRVRYFLLLILTAFLALIGFMNTPAPYNIFWLFVNGLPLGLIWGIVFQYLEGRRITEILTVILSANFIISSGIAKSIGQWIIQQGIAETTMPALVGLIFIPFSLLGIWMLDTLPPPTPSDEKMRVKRLPMNTGHRTQFIKEYGILLFLFVLTYIILTIIRDIRDNFGVELWKELGYGANAGIYTISELPATLLILCTLGLLFLIKNNRHALLVNLSLNGVGIILLIGSTVFFTMGKLEPTLWMIVSGMGLFVPYILFNGILFDRFIAAFQITANVGFIMYMADAFGYLGSVVIMLVKNFGDPAISWLDYYTGLCLVAGFSCLVIMILTIIQCKNMLDKPETILPVLATKSLSSHGQI